MKRISCVDPVSLAPAAPTQDALSARLSVAAEELQDLFDQLGRVGDEIADCSEGDRTALDGRAVRRGSGAPEDLDGFSRLEFLTRFACMTLGAAGAAAGLIGGLSVGLSGSPAVGLSGVGAALVGASVCAGGFLFGQTAPAPAPRVIRAAGARRE